MWETLPKGQHGIQAGDSCYTKTVCAIARQKEMGHRN